jgi:hypothetical protein
MNARLTPLRRLFLLALVVALAPPASPARAQEWEPGPSPYGEENHQIRRDKFDVILPSVMREHDVDMWIHVMREAVPDSFGADELGSESGVFIFTDRGGDRIERAIVGRRWGATQRNYGESDYRLVEESDAYDIIGDPVRVQEPLTAPVTEFDLRFEGLEEFVAQRDPQRIAVNFMQDLGTWPTDRGKSDGISHTDYMLLTNELGPEYSSRLVSSEYLVLDYINQKVPSEIALLKRMRQDDLTRLERTLAAIEPGVTTVDESDVTIFRRTSTGESQRGRSASWEGTIVQGGDVLAAPGLGVYAYVLRPGETAPPEEIQRLWAEYLRVDAILADTIRSGLTPNQIIEEYSRRFDEAGIIVRDDQLHMVVPKNNFPAYAMGSADGETHLTIDAHGQMKGARPWSDETYHAPRVGSYGPSWTKDLVLAPNHHFVIEYFFYMPSVGGDGEDQYLLWWDHEEALATEHGIEYLSEPQTELILIPSSR